ncbi:hypothetical protein Ddc_01535 [Ditylenchus destructor]|nr:hypothetical protein Ddc_01535 [Ditylenchus destructor]
MLRLLLPRVLLLFSMPGCCGGGGGGRRKRRQAIAAIQRNIVLSKSSENATDQYQIVYPTEATSTVETTTKHSLSWLHTKKREWQREQEDRQSSSLITTFMPVIKSLLRWPKWIVNQVESNSDFAFKEPKKSPFPPVNF